MRILFVHHYFPGQFKRIASHYVAEGHDVVALHRGLNDGRASSPIEGVRAIVYGDEAVSDRPEDHVLHDVDQYVREAASAGFRAVELKDSGWIPDLVYDHSGWGTGAFLHDVFPDAKHIRYCEWFFNNTAESGEFLTGERPFESRFMNSLLNLPTLMDLARADLMIAPTDWQRRQFPDAIRRRIRIAPDGVDTTMFCPDPKARFTTPEGKSFVRGDRVATYVARGADPFRGFQPFIEALGLAQAEDPSLHALILGDRKVYYGSGAGREDHFNQVMQKAAVDPARTHFTGVLPYEQYLRALQVSAAHIYLTVPFVLSWSAIEAMAAGCAFIGSDTAPVREFVEHGREGLLVGFDDPPAIASAIGRMLEAGPDVAEMRKAARRRILRSWRAEAAIRRHLSLVASIPAKDQER
ncbi:glycosyltransferase [Rhizobium sp. FKL33]|uniref:glycosyltransferase n=1 Tax=Rhizobium sp. FKL33 TaxID=2562307 RepID=UPI0010C04399|nr:glycosyltransferase [Rhizobium sp. FKL33]